MRMCQNNVFWCTKYTIWGMGWLPLKLLDVKISGDTRETGQKRKVWLTEEFQVLLSNTNLNNMDGILPSMLGFSEKWHNLIQSKFCTLVNLRNWHCVRQARNMRSVQCDKMCFEYPRVIFHWTNGSKFSNLLTVRADRADPPPFTVSLTVKYMFFTSRLSTLQNCHSLSIASH